jgi:hypothetical protein
MKTKSINTSRVVGLSLLCVVLAVSAGTAQPGVNALYTTKEDFINTVMTDSVVTDDQNQIREVLGKKLEVFRNGKRTVYRFGDVYGYYQDGNTYRAYRKRMLFSDYGFYKVVADSGLVVVVYAKKSRHHRSGGNTWYYYSVSPGAAIHRMTKKNLRRDFINKPDFLTKALAILDEQGNRLQAAQQIVRAYYK